MQVSTNRSVTFLLPRLGPTRYSCGDIDVVVGREHGARTPRSNRLRKIEVRALAIFFKRLVQPFVSCTPLFLRASPAVRQCILQPPLTQNPAGLKAHAKVLVRVEDLCGPVDDKRMVLFKLQELRMPWRLWPSRSRSGLAARSRRLARSRVWDERSFTN